MAISILTLTALKSVVVLSAAWVIAALLRGRSAGSRHLVWTAAFASLLALPFLSVSLPALRVHAPAILPNVNFQTTATGTAATPAARSARAVAPAAHPAPRPMNFALWLAVLWAAGAIIALAQMLIGALAIARVRRRARTCDSPDAEALAGALDIRHAVEMLEAPRGSMPMTFGLFRPVIFLPPDAAQWSEERRRVVLLHELAHIRRGDTATHLLARAALSLYWWNPLAWTAWRAFLRERERATDDLVLAAGARASDYAAHLLEVARHMQASPALGWAAVAMARPSQLEGRLLAILDARMNRTAPGRRAAGIASALALMIVGPLAAVQAQDQTSKDLPIDLNVTFRTASAQKSPELLDNAAKAAEAQRKYDIAQQALESANKIREQVSGDRSPEYAAGLIKLGDLERMRKQPAQADAFYQQAVGILGTAAQSAPAYLHLGTDAILAKDYEAAAGYFQQMQVADPSKAGAALMWTAVARQKQGNFEDAESQFRAALALEDEKSGDAYTTMQLYANLLDRVGRADEATAMRQKATELRKSARQAMSRSTATSGVYRVGGGVKAPTLAYKMEPEYTDEARAALYQGTVVVYVEIGPDGAAHNPQVVSGIGLGLDEKAIDAISQWRFNPGTKDGVPVTVAASIEVNFRLL